MFYIKRGAEFYSKSLFLQFSTLVVVDSLAWRQMRSDFYVFLMKLQLGTTRNNYNYKEQPQL